MLKRSHHMPTFMRSAAIHMTGMLVRKRFDQKTWGTMTLQKTISQ